MFKEAEHNPGALTQLHVVFWNKRKPGPPWRGGPLLIQAVWVGLYLINLNGLIAGKQQEGIKHVPI